MGAPKNKGYKRSWKNLLLNARYQLRFTLFMVAICALLMAGLGWWVMRAAEKSTTVAMDNVLGVACQKPDMSAGATAPKVIIEEGDDDGDTQDDADDQGADEAGGDEAGGDEAGANDDMPSPEDAKEPAEPAPADADAPAPPNPDNLGAPHGEPDQGAPVIVDIVEEDVPLAPVPVAAIARYHRCRAQQASTIQRLRANHDRIIYVLIGAGLALCIGLAFYGIKMTHKVAGPLHKVGLYFAKMRDGKYDTVYNLRKGDQLVEFYAHFKEAHEGMRTVETRDVEMLRDLIAAADAAKVGDQSQEAKAALDELRAVLAKKEDAIG